eukprot:3360077-Prorocentrum_lima.AAC.1
MGEHPTGRARTVEIHLIYRLTASPHVVVVVGEDGDLLGATLSLSLSPLFAPADCRHVRRAP